MNRTIKFQLSNILRLAKYSALVTYGGIIIFYLISLLLDQSVISTFLSQPLWLNLLSILVMPLSLLSLLYAAWDGLIFFDSSIRLGISRRLYFIVQFVIYILLSLLTAFASGISTVEWTGSMANFFITLGKNYLSFGNILTEFVGFLGLAIIALGIYRFKVKFFIPIIILSPLIMMIFSISSATVDMSFFIEIIFSIINFVIQYQEVFIALGVLTLVAIYYLFITKIDIQD